VRSRSVMDVPLFQALGRVAVFNRLCRQTGRIDRARDGNVTGLSDEKAKSAAMPQADRSAMNSSRLHPGIVAATAKSVPARPGFIRA